MLDWRGTIVEPIYLFRDMLAENLREFGFNIVSQERTLSEAIQVLEKQEHSRNFILWHAPLNVDIKKSIETIRKYRCRAPATKVILLTDVPRQGSTVSWQVHAEVPHAEFAGVFPRDIPSAALNHMLALVLMEEQFDSRAVAVDKRECVVAPTSLPPRSRQAAHYHGSLDSSSVLPRQFEQPVAFQIEPKSPILSDREQEILACLMQGLSNKVIGRELDIAEGTVKVHIKSLLRKIKARNRTQAAIWALNVAADRREENDAQPATTAAFALNSV